MITSHQVVGVRAGWKLALPSGLIICYRKSDVWSINFCNKKAWASGEGSYLGSALA
jgi:hypothetical protein